jgi:AcrR family transcriptional regulator
MVKKRRPSSRGRAEQGLRTRARMVEAALRTLIEEGYAGTSARAIAARGVFNPALIFYHYGSVDDLLLAALDRSSAERLERYRAAMFRPGAPDELVRRASELFREDVEGGHVTAVTELIGASLAKPELRAEVVARMRPWLELTEQVMGRLLAESPFGAFAPAAEPAAFAVVSGYLGLNMLSRLMPDLRQTERLFQLAQQVSRLASSG